jgi:hypothetical protein
VDPDLRFLAFCPIRCQKMRVFEMTVATALAASAFLLAVEAHPSALTCGDPKLVRMSCPCPGRTLLTVLGHS